MMILLHSRPSILMRGLANAVPAPRSDGVIVKPKPACPTILPGGDSCMPNEPCIRRGGTCAIVNNQQPIVCKCVY